MIGPQALDDSRAPRKSASHHKLIVWQRAVELAVESYRVTRMLPDEERFGLSGQIRRAAVSVASNIAEGHARPHRRDFVRFLVIARGSTSELDTQYTIAERAGLIRSSELERVAGLLDETSRMLARMIHSLSSQ